MYSADASLVHGDARARHDVIDEIAVAGPQVHDRVVDANEVPEMCLPERPPQHRSAGIVRQARLEVGY